MRVRVFLGILFILLGLSAFMGIDIVRFIGPLFLIFIGWTILTGRHKSVEQKDARSYSQDSVNEVSVFSGIERKIVSTDFTGGKIVAVFGGADFDISDAKTKQKHISMELISVFGGIRMKVPKQWNVALETVGIIGGVDNRTESGAKSIELRIKGAAVFGGIEIYN